ncbi:SDR family oxidoreductase [Acidisoma cellulosilytica]|uniref:SDR family oxidoreductase n=1 Tax=Acidisoma cellulosilyticum TaxID=2802395 RepID=A0A963YXQ5_9PROT|nr:SDR family oxidoreductase [Acidisoma cellulosilyticum]MCB8878875.1 SDR family oxidoreductase [Acidisoma cellulosilyticum]
MRRSSPPDDIAAAVAFLLWDDAGFMTGQTLHIDGARIGKAAF